MSDNESIDPGMGGFHAIFGESSQAETPSPETPADDTAQPEATSAETATPETSDDGQDLSAEDVVAARLAASLEADGIAVPEPGEEGEADTEAATAEPEISLENLTPEQLQTLLDQVEQLQSQVTKNDRQAVAEKVMAAERQAVEQVWQEFDQQVVAKSERHYNAEFAQRVSKAYDQAETQPNPKQWLLGQIAADMKAVLDSRQAWEAQQQEAYEQRAIEAAITARKSVPELRKLYAEELAVEFELPPQVVVPLILKVSDTDDFRAEAERLAGVRDFAAKQQSDTNTTKRQKANQELRENRVRTPATARPRGGEVPEYTGKFAEFRALRLGNR